jgi:hypothetical protein
MLADMKGSGVVKLSVHLTGGVFKGECRLSAAMSGGRESHYCALIMVVIAELPSLRVFRCKKLNYVWDEDRGEFLKLCGLDRDVSTAALHEQQGLSAHQQVTR